MIERTYNLERHGYERDANCINNSIKCIYTSLNKNLINYLK